MWEKENKLQYRARAWKFKYLLDICKSDKRWLCGFSVGHSDNLILHLSWCITIWLYIIQTKIIAQFHKTNLDETVARYYYHEQFQVYEAVLSLTKSQRRVLWSGWGMGEDMVQITTLSLSISKPIKTQPSREKLCIALTYVGHRLSDKRAHCISFYSMCDVRGSDNFIFSYALVRAS